MKHFNNSILTLCYSLAFWYSYSLSSLVTARVSEYYNHLHIFGARNRFLYGFMFVYIYIYIYIIYIYICMYIYICQDGGAVGFVEFTKLLFALSSLAQPLKRLRSIP